jgi:hypothetical protein
MAVTYKTLGQSAPSATTETDLYTVPGATSAVVSTLTICNRGASAGTVRVNVSVGGGATANKEYLYYELTVAAYDTFAATMGVTLAATDKVKIYASSGNFSFNLFGSEHT